jgi:hypothetical protein
LGERAGAVGIGVLTGLMTIVLLQASLTWILLLAAGLVVVTGSLVVRNARQYWLAVFLATIPLNITKLFFWTPEDVEVIKRTYGIFINENLVPQLYLADLPLLVLLALWLGDIALRRQRIRIPSGVLTSIAFLVWCVTTLALARAPMLGFVWVLYEVKCLVMLLWFVNARLSRVDVRRAVAVLLLSLVAQSAVTFYTYTFQTGENVFGSLFGRTKSARETIEGPARGSGAAYVFERGDLLRGTGTIGTANLEAKYFVLLLPLALAGAMCGRRPLTRVACGAAFVMGMAALALTFSRGGVITGLAAVAVLPCVLARRGLLKGGTLALFAVAALTVAVLAAPMLLRFFGSRPQFTHTRLDHLTYGLEILRDHLVVGVGMNNFNVNVTGAQFDGTFAGSPIHNHYLRVAIETGLPGALLQFGFFVWVIVQAYRATAAGDPLVAAIGAAVFAGLVGIAMYWSDDIFYDPIVRTQTWVMAALALVLRRLQATPSTSSTLHGALGAPAHAGTGA